MYIRYDEMNDILFETSKDDPLYILGAEKMAKSYPKYISILNKYPISEYNINFKSFLL